MCGVQDSGCSERVVGGGAGQTVYRQAGRQAGDRQGRGCFTFPGPKMAWVWATPKRDRETRRIIEGAVLDRWGCPSKKSEEGCRAEVERRREESTLLNK